jgi:hypothetical protein
VKMYQKMLGEWKEFNLSSRVLLVDYRFSRAAVIEDSGTQVSIALGREVWRVLQRYQCDRRKGRHVRGG